MLDGEWELPMAVERMKKNTRVYAKKQMTWYQRDESITWFHPDDGQAILQHVLNCSRQGSTLLCRNKHTERQKQYCRFPFPSLLANSCRYACTGSPQYCFSFVKRVEPARVVQLGCWRNAVRRPSQRAVLVIAARCIGLRSIVRFRHLPSAVFAVTACVGMFAVPACSRRSAAPSRLASFLRRSLLFFPSRIASF